MFLWGANQGKAKCKWGSWLKLCKPIGEGGIGVHDLSEVQKAFFMKFAWRLLTMDNLWTQFFLAKYVKNDHIWNTKPTQVGSRFWKEILKVIPEVHKNYFVKIRDGKSSF